MLPGYNTDIQHQGSIYHIQTEDNGQANPSIVTLVYQGGAILARKKSDYRHLLSESKPQEKVRRLMQEQHQQMIKSILSGQMESLQQEGTPEAKEKAVSPSLDSAIMKFLSEVPE